MKKLIKYIYWYIVITMCIYYPKLQNSVDSIENQQRKDDWHFRYPRVSYALLTKTMIYFGTWSGDSICCVDCCVLPFNTWKFPTLSYFYKTKHMLKLMIQKRTWVKEILCEWHTCLYVQIKWTKQSSITSIRACLFECIFVVVEHHWLQRIYSVEASRT